MAGVRRLIVCLVVALASLGVAGTVGASGGEAAPSTAPSPSIPAGPSKGVLPPVTEHDLDVVPAAGSQPRSVTEVVALEILPGTLTLVTPRATVVLRRDGDGRWSGTLPPVRVVDARGSLVGWRVRWALAGVEADGRAAGGRLLVTPDGPAVVDGSPAGLHAGSPPSHVLFESEAGAGGGTYEAGARLRLELAGRDAETVTVTLTFSIR